MKLLKAFAAVTLFATALSAQASLINIVGGATYPMSEHNDFFFNPLVIPEYNIGGNVYAAEDISVKYSLIGHSAGFDTEFWADGNPAITNGGLNGPAYSSVLAGTLFDFYFRAVDYVGNNFIVANGWNQGPELPSFAIALDVTYEGVFYDAILMFDDTGNRNDDNHDDLVVGVNVSRVPEPSTVLLLTMGLAGLLGARRLKS